MRSLATPLKYLTVLFMVALISVGIIGASYAYFSETTSFRTTATMGSLDVVFTRLDIIGCADCDKSCIIEANIVDAGKNIELNVENAYPGFTTVLLYEVTNTGTVPVTYQLGQACQDGPVFISVSSDTDYIAPATTGQGKITFMVKEDIEDIDSCGINVALNFQQAAVVS